jgi:hypothetical protein
MPEHCGRISLSGSSQISGNVLRIEFAVTNRIQSEIVGLEVPLCLDLSGS